MKRIICGTVLLVLLFSAIGLQAEQPRKKLPPIRIVVVGDSTVATYKKNAKGHWSKAGWGQFLADAFNDKVTVINCALGGRSSSSFVWEGHWARALSHKPDYVFIQFGHNDCPGKGIRETDPKTSFRDYIRKYIAYTRKAGARPVLVTPMTRRNFDASGKIKTVLRPYAEAMIAVGREEKVPVIDLHAASVALFNRLGEADSADLNCSARDHTHFSAKGARTMVRLITEQLPKVEPLLGPYLKSAPDAVKPSRDR